MIKRTPYVWRLSRTTLELGKRTLVMGILNVTPDSFSDGGLYFTAEQAIARGREIEQEGADILDIGGESTRPGGEDITEEEELRRVMPVLEALCPALKIPVSIDTYRSGVAQRAIEAGAQIINDISGFRFDPELAAVARRTSAGVVLMHSLGARGELFTQPVVEDPAGMVREDLAVTAQVAIDAGITRASIVLDPGFGFGKTSVAENLKLLRDLDALAPLQYPLLVGTSRKSFIRRIIPDNTEARLMGTAATVVAAVTQGAHIVRVHDVRPIRALVDVTDAITYS